MIQQSLTRSLLGKAGSGRRRSGIRWPKAMMLAGLVICGPLCGRAISQYSQPPQTIYGGGYTPANAATSNPDAIQLANQSDQQLFSEARLFEQQGRSAQAQRIYLELQRRSLIRSQSSPATFHHAPPRGYSAYGSTAPSAGVSTSTWTPAAGPPNGRASQNQNVPPNQQIQTAAPFELPQQSADVGSAAATVNANSDRENFSLQAVPLGTQETARSNADTQINTAQSGAPILTTAAQSPVMVLDRQVTPAAPQVEPNTNGWRPAVTPLPAALVHGEPVASQVPVKAVVSVSDGRLELKAEIAKPAQPAAATIAAPPITPAGIPESNGTGSKRAQPMMADEASIPPMHPMELARRAAVEATKGRPNMPAQARPDVPTLPAETANVPETLRLDQEPAAFVTPPAVSERPLPAAAPQEPAGVVTLPSAAPATLQLSPQSVPRAVPLQTDREDEKSLLDTAARLAKQTDDIRIIPGNRTGGHSRLEDLLSTGSSTETAPADGAIDSPTMGWKSYLPASESNPNQEIGPRTETARAGREPIDETPASQKHVRADASAERDEASESRRTQPSRVPQFVEKSTEPKPAFNLAALIQDPEFREIHTRPVLDGLELLSQPEPRHRLLGALRIGASGPEARTALPALRQLLGEEANKTVRLRIAEAILRLQPSDRSALEALSHFLIDPNDADLRQAAAGALGVASASSNLTAIVCLTDALDDASPRVRIMAALSLAQFGSSAVDAVPRLEMAATSDVPRMQRAALAALTAIRGRQVSQNSKLAQDSRPVGTPMVESRSPVPRPVRVTVPVPVPVADPVALPLPAQISPADRPTFDTAPPKFDAPPPKFDSANPRSAFVDQGNAQNPAITRAMMFPVFPGPPAALGDFESRTTTAEGPTAPQQVSPMIPTRGISLHEIEADGASADSRSRHQLEPVHLPEGPARPIERPIERPVEITPPRPAPAAPKPAPPQLPLTEDSPLNLESQAGAAKPGSTQ
ncbi:MAG TPA: HEAT repeat domain-containing protein [Planctomycetaceae bacterium]|nr:HEAT repeat domain-containing protein [Planctomycetaceae bacterium]